MMNDSSRKLKNPLLTAAGQGFSLDDHGGTTLLMPVIQSSSVEPIPTTQSVILSQSSGTSGEIIDTQSPQQNVDNSSITVSSNISCSSSNYSSLTDSSKNLISPAISLSDVPQIPTGVGVSNYRLGNQRRLKYVPPPNLTSTVQKPLTQLPISGQVDAPYTVNSVINPHHHLLKPTDNVTGTGTNLTTSAELNSIHDVISVAPIKFPPTSSVNSPSNTYQDYIDGDKFSSTTTPVPQPISSTLTSISLKKNTPDYTDIALQSSNDISSASIFFDTKKNTSIVNEPAQIDLIQTPHNFDNSQAQSSVNLIKTQFDSIHKDNYNSASFYDNVELSKNYESSTIQLFTPTFINDSVSQVQNPIESGFDLTSQSGFISAMPEPTGSATLNPTQISVNSLLTNRNNISFEKIPHSLEKLASAQTTVGKKMSYRPVYYHWFYRREIENKIVWNPFSMQDSLNLETIYNSNEITPETTVATDGGRYDVEILKRRRIPIYWSGPSLEVRRSSWFYKGPSESRYMPYDENTATRLEEEYKQACSIDQWNRRIDLNNGEYIIFHSSTIQVHYLPTTSPELVASWGNSSGASSRPKVVKRGVDEFHIDEGEPETIDHLLFLVHGIGSVCDLKFRTVEEVVDEFRGISLQLLQSHYRTANTHGIVNRIEVLPISWHTTLHSEATGIDKKLEAITLDSIPKLRHFTNDTLLDILFYTSPTYCQTIMQTVGNEMNRLHTMFKERNPSFSGCVYLGGHSLGSLILFDLLCHQKPPIEGLQNETLDESADSDNNEPMEGNSVAIKPMPQSIVKRRLSRRVSYVMGAAGTGQPFINYPQLNFQPKAFFAFGSPIGMFVTIRGIDNLGKNFTLPTCPAFFNIFHPFDPVAYRIEALVSPEANKYRPMLIPHHKGRKRMHLELKETMARVGADLKQKLLDSMRSTWNSVYHLAMFHRSDNQILEQEIDKVVEEQLQSSCEHSQSTNSANDDGSDDDANFDIGKLNGGRRIDYVLQEAPLEYINEYIFALTSHVCYWESEDTMLFILKEMYGSNGIQADTQLPQQIMRISEGGSSDPLSRSSTSLSLSETPFISELSTTMRNSIPSELNLAQSPIDPTMPTIANKSVGPPPTSGFVRKT